MTATTPDQITLRAYLMAYTGRSQADVEAMIRRGEVSVAGGVVADPAFILTDPAPFLPRKVRFSGSDHEVDGAIVRRVKKHGRIWHDQTANFES